MLKNIILKVIADKKQRNIEPNHATFKEVYSIGQKQGLSATSIKSGINELYLGGDIEVGDTLNDKWIRIL